jgi:hypothetical protein
MAHLGDLQVLMDNLIRKMDFIGLIIKDMPVFAKKWRRKIQRTNYMRLQTVNMGNMLGVK